MSDNKKIYIIVRHGIIEYCYSNEHDLEVEVIDFDNDMADTDELEEIVTEIEEDDKYKEVY